MRLDGWLSQTQNDGESSVPILRDRESNGSVGYWTALKMRQQEIRDRSLDSAMHQIVKLTWVAALSVAGVFFAAGVFAQDTEPAAVEQIAAPDSEDLVKQLRIQVESALAQIGEDSELEDSVKDSLRSKYEQVIETLKEAAAAAAKAAAYRTSLKQAPDTAAKLREQLKELPAVESAGKVKAPANPDDLQQELDAQRATLVALTEQLSNVAADPSLTEQRPAEIGERIPEVNRELAEVRKQLESSGPSDSDPVSGLMADRVLLQARELKLQSELEMLEQDQLSQSVRRSLQQAQEELLTRQVENASASIEAYQALMTERDTEAAQDIVTAQKNQKWRFPRMI